MNDDHLSALTRFVFFLLSLSQLNFGFSYPNQKQQWKNNTQPLNWEQCNALTRDTLKPCFSSRMKASKQAIMHTNNFSIHFHSIHFCSSVFFFFISIINILFRVFVCDFLVSGISSDWVLLLLLFQIIQWA